MSGQPRSPSATYIATDHNKATIRMDEVNSTMLNISASESHSHKGQTALIALFVFVSIIGITGNSFSIYLLSRKRLGRRRRILSHTYRIYIIALAIADNGMLFFNAILRYVVVDLIYEAKESSRFYEIYLCRWHRMIMHACHNAAVWLLVAMAFDRFIAVCFPFKYREMKHDSSKAKKVTSCVFVLSFIFATPFLASGPVYEVKNTTATNLLNFNQRTINSTRTNAVFNQKPFASDVVNLKTRRPTMLPRFEATDISNREEQLTKTIVTECSLEATFSESVSYVISFVFHVLLTFLIPYFVLLLLNIVTLRSLHFPSNKNAAGSRRLHRKITVMMLVVCFTFIILWLPKALLLMTTSEAHAHNKNNEMLNSLATLSGMLNSALNFVLYCFTVKRFRDEAWNQVRHIFCCKTDDLPESVSREKFSKLSKSTDKRKNSSQSSAIGSSKTPMILGKTKVVYNANPNHIDHVTLLIGGNHPSVSDQSSSTCT